MLYFCCKTKTYIYDGKTYFAIGKYIGFLHNFNKILMFYSFLNKFFECWFISEILIKQQDNLYIGQSSINH